MTIRYISIDARINAQRYNFPYAEYYIELPETICRVKSLSVVSAEIPIVFYLQDDDTEKNPQEEQCSIISTNAPRYAYVELFEYPRHHTHDNEYLFTSSILLEPFNKYIISRVVMDYKNYPAGSLLPVNLLNGLLISGVRQYKRPIKISNLNIRLLNELCFPICMKCDAISLCIQVECEDHE
jgi:hypothetical protein